MSQPKEKGSLLKATLLIGGVLGLMYLSIQSREAEVKNAMKDIIHNEIKVINKDEKSFLSINHNLTLENGEKICIKINPKFQSNVNKGDVIVVTKTGIIEKYDNTNELKKYCD